MPKENCAGFTIIETVVAIFGFVVVALGLIILLEQIFSVSAKQSALLSDVDQARSVTFKITSELRNAQRGNDGSYQLVLANPQEIVFFANWDNDSNMERVHYYIKNNQLWKGVTKFNGTAYNTSTEQSILVQRDLANGSQPVFYYYTDSYDGTAATDIPLSQPVSILQVRFIKVGLLVYNQAGKYNTGVFSVTAGAAIRNLKDNLGN